MKPRMCTLATSAALALLLALAALPRAGAQPQQGAPAAAPGAAAWFEPAPTAWPRTFKKADATVVLYQPQVDSWTNHAQIRFRAVVAVTAPGDKQQHYGVAAVEAATLVDDAARTVLITNMDAAVRFDGIAQAKADQLKALVKECLPSLNYLDVPLDQVLAYTHRDAKPRVADVSMAPPPIYYSSVPAILVIYMGQPQFKPIQATKLMFAANTNWVVIMDTASSQYFLLDNGGWLTAPDPIKGPWTPALTLPDGFFNLPSDPAWSEVTSQVPGAPITSVPRVITTTTPAELIVTNGPLEYTPLDGTRLMYVSNPATPLFLDLIDDNYYFLTSGRWFRSASPSGPWTAASADLPAEFAKISPDSPMGFVLASVPGTQEARDAVLLATVPHMATINISTAKCAVAYQGAPKFAPIAGTTMTYAVNTAYQVVCVAPNYFCCFQGVWFVAPAATGPWAVCTSVPAVIYTIPPSSPLYNITYVQVYSSTPDTVVVGATAGYSGEYVAATGALMFGAGMLAGALLADNDCWYGCQPCYYSYGCASHYSYACGGYYRAGGSYYGPYGGAGWGSAYNPSTGTYARGGAAYGPGGAAWGAQAYNPYTNTYAQHTGSTNGYQSWGNSYVQQGNKWAESSHESTAAGGVATAQNSSGQWAEGAHSNVTNSSVAATSSGDMYASHNGNVYKNTGSGWQSYDGNGAWSDTSANKPSSTPQSTNSAASESNFQNSMQSHSSGGGDSWGSQAQGSQWKSNFENGGGSGSGSSNAWSQHDAQQGLNQDSWARNQGNQNSASSWQNRSGSGGGGMFGGGGGGDQFGQGGGASHSGGWGGGSRWGGGGGGGGFRGGGRR